MQEMCNNTEKKMIRVRTVDKKEFEVPEVVARMPQAIRLMIDDGCADDIIPLPNVDSEILRKALAYCKMHVYKKEGADLDTGLNESARPLTENDMEKWDKEFITNVDQNTLFDLILAANYLEIQGLLNLGCKSVAEQMMSKTPEEIRKHFNIVNDYTPEEEEEARREISWVFQ